MLDSLFIILITEGLQSLNYVRKYASLLLVPKLGQLFYSWSDHIIWIKQSCPIEKKSEGTINQNYKTIKTMIKRRRINKPEMQNELTPGVWKQHRHNLCFSYYLLHPLLGTQFFQLVLSVKRDNLIKLNY